MASPIRPDSKAQRILRLLAEGHATTNEVAAELEVPTRLASAHLCHLVTRGLVVRDPIRGPTGKAYLWRLA